MLGIYCLKSFGLRVVVNVWRLFFVKLSVLSSSHMVSCCTDLAYKKQN